MASGPITSLQIDGETLETVADFNLGGSKITTDGDCIHEIKRHLSLEEGADVEAETPILWPPNGKSWLIWKDPDAGKDWRQEEKGMTEDEMVGWYHWFNGH